MYIYILFIDIQIVISSSIQPPHIPRPPGHVQHHGQHEAPHCALCDGRAPWGAQQVQGAELWRSIGRSSAMGFCPGENHGKISGEYELYIYITYMTYVWCLEYERLVSFCSMFSWRMIFWWCCIIMVSSCGWYEMKHLSVKVGPHVEECQPLGHHQYECGMMMRSPFSSCGLLGVCELLGRPWIEIVFPMWPCVQSFRHNKILKSAVFVVTFKLFMQLIRSKPI
jgi:hypothetical protein